MECSGEQIIEQLRKKVEQSAQRKSQQLKAERRSLNFPNKEGQIFEKPKTNIFQNMKKPEQNNLFKGQGKSVNLFQIKKENNTAFSNGGQQGAKNIFNILSNPSVQESQQKDSQQQNNEDGGEGEDVPSQSQNIFKTQPDVKVMKYEYKNQLQKILELPLKKFKNGVSIAKQNIYVSIQKFQNQPSTLYLLVRSNTTKVLVYQGIIVKNISKFQHFLGKPDNLKFDVLNKKSLQNSQGSQQQKQNKLTKQIVKLQFQKVQDCQKFKSQVNNYFAIGSY